MDNATCQDPHNHIFLDAPQKSGKRTEVVDIFDRGGTRHEAVVPFGYAYTSLPTVFQRPSSKTYLFELDDFQKISVCSLERDESVLVSAHTSSGKTVVAEYAIAMSLKSKQRVVYTSPIKALSNQKYRELLSEFQDVGLMTGDVTINPTASCLVMTTEILRNMLYRGGEVVREIHWIIFDEIHYMRDKERGVVWEETIILLPKHIRMVFLSATIPNALEFAEWISFIQNQVVHVVYTEKRVTPLVHYFKSDKLYKIKDTKFHKSNFLSAMRSTRKRKIGYKDVNNAIKDASLPVVVFSFRRKDCERFATQLDGNYLSDEEAKMVRMIFTNAIVSLRKEDREIPIIQNILPLLARGIGIHHSGLLPIIKEVVEILFQEGLLKVLFATETFSIGLNMPAKSVVFTALKKYDGERTRLINPGEYIQMSGRAGRRGLDEMGIVICIISEPITQKEVDRLLSPSSENLISAFRLTYNMILNLMRVEDLNPLYLISRSFFHFQAYKKSLGKEAEVFEMYAQLEQMKPNDVARMYIERETMRVERNMSLKPMIGEYLKKGRVVDLFIPRGGPSLIVRNAIVSKVNENVRCMVNTDKGVYMCNYPLHYVDCVYNSRVKLNLKVFSRKFEKILIDSDLDKNIEDIEAKIADKCPGWNGDECAICGNVSTKCLLSCGLEFLNGKCVEEIDLNDCNNQRIPGISECSRRSRCKDKCLCNSYTCEQDVSNHGDMAIQLESMAECKQYFISEVSKRKYLSKLSELNQLYEIYHMKECMKMIEVLKKLEYCDDTTVLIKGKMACEISSGDELVLTEMILNGDFAGLPAEHFIPLLSCIVFEEWDSENFVLSDENKRYYKLLSDSVEKVCKVLKSCSIGADPAVYLKRFSYELMDVVRMWVCGHTFTAICNSTSIFEGSIIRTFRRLEELFRQLGCAARVIGNTDLESMFELGITKIKRDIIFANSLYI
ncbi:ATP-dependent RNA helicase mtr4 [Ordospora colligata]|uniref:Superfamily II RNA helicase n=1 Tax=Ordospora colligata OC4 TaxID=1354746 RepID=A0A0B2UKP3_9MICR|nr:superfamily II RNA helicase [Ordospora colligata OC4]KHN69938.1 superfamily II RNA helicase [Ordospora colligata OC4]TBU16108.1 superfamily II RNA helicase [Ordospora colligata]TBU16321.1 superfamily II RNA helicase [Ordospora colligata]